MKKLITICTIALCMHTQAQQAWYNNGSIVQINGNAIVQVNGAFTNGTGSSYVNDGKVNIKGTVTNNQYMATPNGGVTRFEGTSPQTVNGSFALFAKNVEIAGPVILNDSLKIGGECNFINGVLSANTANQPLWFTGSAFVSTTNVPTNASHVKGFVVKEGNGIFTYPVGDSVRYQPVEITLLGNSNGMQVRYDSTNTFTGPYSPMGTEPVPLISHGTGEHWNCTPLGTADGKVKIFWDNYRNVPVTVPSGIRVAHYTSAAWLNEGMSNMMNISPTNGWVESNLLNTWSPFTLGSLAQVLPLKWLFVNATINNSKQALVTWKVQETNVAAYEIQKSTNATTFQTIGYVNSKGDGENDYVFMETQLLSGKAFYRIKQTDKDGKITYSKTMLLNVNTNSAVTVYPNPTANIVTINSTGLLNTKAILTDISGKALQTINITQQNTSINLGSYASGIYLLKLQNGETVKLIKE